jgi:hypothetical protein
MSRHCSARPAQAAPNVPGRRGRQRSGRDIGRREQVQSLHERQAARWALPITQDFRPSHSGQSVPPPRPRSIGRSPATPLSPKGGGVAEPQESLCCLSKAALRRLRGGQPRTRASGRALSWQSARPLGRGRAGKCDRAGRRAETWLSPEAGLRVAVPRPADAYAAAHRGLMSDRNAPGQRAVRGRATSRCPSSLLRLRVSSSGPRRVDSPHGRVLPCRVALVASAQIDIPSPMRGRYLGSHGRTR